MSQTTLAIATLGSILTSLLYVYIGRVIRLRKVSPDARLANGMFVLWWHSLGALGFLGALTMMLYMAGTLDDRIWLFQAYTTVVILILFLALWGLQFYLLYLYTGSRRWFMPLAVFYSVLFLLTEGLIEYIGSPDRVVDNGWQLKTEYLDPATGEYGAVEFGMAFNLIFSALIIGPALLTAIAYARLYRKTDDRTQRYRIALVTGAIIVWFGSSVIGTALEVTGALAWQLFTRVIGILGAIVILMAYKPPRWVRERYRVDGVENETGQQPLSIINGASPPRAP